VLLARIQPLLDATRRPQQSGFVAGRSTIDAILALRLLAEIHREFDRPLHVAFLDIKAAFDSVDRQALWKALRSRGIPNILLDLIVALHEHSGSSVRHGGKLSTRFLTTSGVRQGCVLAPALFCVAINWILNHINANPGIRVGSSSFTDLMYADDAILFATLSQSAVESLSSFQNAPSIFGMHISCPKTKVQNFGTGQPLSDVSVDAHHVECVNNFTYLGNVQSSNGYCTPDIRRRIALAASVMSSLRNI